MKKAAKKTPSKDKTAPELSQLATRIRTLRKQKGYKSHEAFALDAGISRTQYGRYERGAEIQYTTLVRIVRQLDMTLEEFFEGFE